MAKPRGLNTARKQVSTRRDNRWVRISLSSPPNLPVSFHASNASRAQRPNSNDHACVPYPLLQDWTPRSSLLLGRSMRIAPVVVGVCALAAFPPPCLTPLSHPKRLLTSALFHTPQPPPYPLLDHHRPTLSSRSELSATSTRPRPPAVPPRPRVSSSRRSVSRQSSLTRPSESASVSSSSRTARRLPPSSPTTAVSTLSTRTTRFSSPVSVVPVRPRVISPVFASRSSRSLASV